MRRSARKREVLTTAQLIGQGRKLRNPLADSRLENLDRVFLRAVYHLTSLPTRFGSRRSSTDFVHYSRQRAAETVSARLA